MNYIYSFIFSAIEFASFIILTLVTFRFSLSPYKKEIVVLSSLLSGLSLVLDFAQLQSIAPIIQLIVLIVLFKFLMKENVWYSILVNVLGFIFFNVIEAAFFLILKFYSVADMTDLGGTHNITTYALQLSASLIVFIVSSIIKNMNQGFGFIYKFRSGRNKIKTTNKYLVIVSSLSIVLLSGCLYFLLAHKNLFTFLAFLVVLLTFNITLFYLYNKRDKEQYGASA